MEQLKSVYLDLTNIEMGTSVGMETLKQFSSKTWPKKILFGDDYPMMTEQKLQSERGGSYIIFTPH